MLYRFLTLALTSVVAAQALTQPQPIGLSKKRAQRFKGNGVQLQADTDCEHVEEMYFAGAVVDNFADVGDQVKWSGSGQRYFVNDQYWGGDGYPIFVAIGGKCTCVNGRQNGLFEATMTMAVMTRCVLGESAESCNTLSGKLYISTLAEQHKALLLSLEHRYYGKSYPTANMDNQNIGYLTSAQALADLARFIEWYKQSRSISASRVITFGGSYPGNLAAWFRLKYPHVTDGSVASSAPVTAKEDFSEYMDVVGASLKYFGGKKCYNAFKAAADAVQVKIDNDDLSTLEQDFRTCDTISTGANKDKDIATLLSMLMGNVQGTVQYNLLVSTWMTIDDVCEVMLDGPDAYTQFVELNQLYLDQNGEECTDASYSDFIDYLKVATFNEADMYRQWYYQTCNEFGYFQTTNSPNQPFYSWKHLDLVYYTDVCEEVYGYSKSPQISWINNYYGATGIAGTNIVFPTGSIDPWYILGVTDKTKLKMVGEHDLMITGTAHCADMYAPRDTDTDAMKSAHDKIAELVSQFLAETGDGGLRSSNNLESGNKSSSNGSTFGSTVVIVATVAMGVVISLSGGYYFHRKVQDLNARTTSMQAPLIA